ncbi:hypothetical protein OH77DRAFT_718664 [Trametes cingulata]|nr:hypothetical protein OH77DRAFT_718664 [Trametes cingulata]
MASLRDDRLYDPGAGNLVASDRELRRRRMYLHVRFKSRVMMPVRTPARPSIPFPSEDLGSSPAPPLIQRSSSDRAKYRRPWPASRRISRAAGLLTLASRAESADGPCRRARTASHPAGPSGRDS